MVVGGGGGKGGLEEASLDNTGFVVAELAATLLLWPELAAHTLPGVPGSAGESVVVAPAVAGARSTTV